MVADKRLDSLVEVIGRYGSVAVAFSGGADSSLVAYAAYAALGKEAIAVHISSETVPLRDSTDANSLAGEIGIKLSTIEVNILEDVSFTENPPDRCGSCKERLMGEVISHAASLNITTVADGGVLDDLSDYRPGHRVSDRMGIKHPLIEAGLSKNDVMELLEIVKLSSSGKPPSPCLASRIPYGQMITMEKLEMIDRLEERLRGLGLETVRVRLHETVSGGLLGVIEADDVALALEKWAQFRDMEPQVKLLLDPRGYRMGSMNEVLTSP